MNTDSQTLRSFLSPIFLQDYYFFIPRTRFRPSFCLSLHELPESMAGMATKKRYIPWAWILLVLLTLLSLDSIYWLIFFLWRSAAEPAVNNLWLPRIYIWLSPFIITGIAWVTLLIWVVRRGRKSDCPTT